MEVTVWIVVGVFAAMVNGRPDVSIVAADDLYKTKAECEAHQARIDKRVSARDDTKEVVMTGYGTGCVEVKIKKVEPKPNV